MGQSKLSGADFLRSAAIVVLFGVSGCRFVTPDVKEQQELARRGALGSGAPAWMAASNKGVDAAGRSSFGFLPDSYSANLSGTSVSSVYTTISEEDAYRRLEKEKITAASQNSSTEKEGPLDRIAKACPGMEKEVNDALTTVDSKERLDKYSALTNRCSASADLWLWTGKAYLTQGKLSDAARSFQQAITVDPQNTEDSELLDETKKQQEKAKASKDKGPK